MKRESSGEFRDMLSIKMSIIVGTTMYSVNCKKDLGTAGRWLTIVLI